MKHIFKEAKVGANRLRKDGYSSEADAILSVIVDAEYDLKKRSELSKLKKGDHVVMHTCMESDNPKYLGHIWKCRTDSFRAKGHNYCSIFLEGFSGSFSAEFLQLVDIKPFEAELTKEREALRPALRWFAEQQETTLKQNDQKGGWQNCDVYWLLQRLREETEELDGALIDLGPIEVIKEATDVANFAMMIADNARSILGGNEPNEG